MVDESASHARGPRLESRWEHSSFSLKSPDFVSVATRVAFSGMGRARIGKNYLLIILMSQCTQLDTILPDTSAILPLPTGADALDVDIWFGYLSPGQHFCAKQAIIYRKKAFAERLQSALCVNVVSMLSLCGCRLAQAATQSNSLIRSVSYVVGIHRLQSYQICSST